MIRPIIYKLIRRLAVGLGAGLLWARFYGENYGQTQASPRGDALFLMGAICLAMAWVNYLRLDGMKLPDINLVNKLRNAGQRKQHSQKGLIDFVGDEPQPVRTLTDTEERLCSLAANILAGLAFIIAGII